MHEIALMDPSKTTDNKLRWQAFVDGVNFKLYIPKWRVPKPWPMRVLVTICDAQDITQASDQLANSSELEHPIVSLIGRVNDHTETVRFAPFGDPKEWQIGEPYIPYNMLPNPSVKTLLIKVEWDRSAGTWSDTVEETPRFLVLNREK